MTAVVTVVCVCGAKYKLAAGFKSDRAKCKGCGHVIDIAEQLKDASTSRTGDPSEAYEAERMPQDRDDVMTREPVDPFEAAFNRGVALREMGNLTESKAVLTQVVAQRRRLHGDEHDATIVALSQLGRTLRAHGDAFEARRLHEECLATRRRQLGSCHQFTIGSMRVLADTLVILGDNQGASKLLAESKLSNKTQAGATNGAESSATRPMPKPPPKVSRSIMRARDVLARAFEIIKRRFVQDTESRRLRRWHRRLRSGSVQMLMDVFDSGRLGCAKDANGNTTLHLAAQMCNYRIVQHIMAHSINAHDIESEEIVSLDAQNDAGMTAADLAIARGRRDIAISIVQEIARRERSVDKALQQLIAIERTLRFDDAHAKAGGLSTRSFGAGIPGMERTLERLTEASRFWRPRRIILSGPEKEWRVAEAAYRRILRIAGRAARDCPACGRVLDLQSGFSGCPACRFDITAYDADVVQRRLREEQRDLRDQLNRSPGTIRYPPGVRPD